MSARLTSDPGNEWLATWSPDGSRIIFSSEHDSTVSNLYQKASSGAGNEDLLLKSNEQKSAQDWSRDGRFLLYSVNVKGEQDNEASHDLWVLPLTPGDDKAELYLGTEFNESQGQFSPDSRMIAYSSNASGGYKYEIYVQPFPKASSDKWKVSTGGGIAPRWRGDGKELFYVSADSKMMAVEVSTSPVLKFGTPKVLFHAPILRGGTIHNVTRYDVSADGKRFLINSATAEGAAPPPSPITIVLNWTTLLKQ
jgi:Tol biopolymer transport system component